MSHLDHDALGAGSMVASPDSPEARSRRLHAEFEIYYAERERRRLTAEALARRMAAWCMNGRVPAQVDG
jgi:hypothetical protein